MMKSKTFKKTLQMLLASSVLLVVGTTEVRADTAVLDFNPGNGTLNNTANVTPTGNDQELIVTFANMNHWEIVNPEEFGLLLTFENKMSPLTFPPTLDAGIYTGMNNLQLPNTVFNEKAGIEPNTVGLLGECTGVGCTDPFIHGFSWTFLEPIPMGTVITAIAPFQVNNNDTLVPGVWAPSHMSMIGWVLLGLAGLGLIGWHKRRMSIG